MVNQTQKNMLNYAELNSQDKFESKAGTGIEVLQGMMGGVSVNPEPQEWLLFVSSYFQRLCSPALKLRREARGCSEVLLHNSVGTKNALDASCHSLLKKLGQKI